MSQKAETQPSSGGSYVRTEDGQLKLVERTQEQPTASQAQAAETTTRKRK